MKAERSLAIAKAESLIELSRSNRSLAETTFGALSFDEQLQLVSQVNAEDRKDLLFLARDCAKLVRALPEDGLYLSVKSGTDIESIILLELGNKDQLMYFFDIECWDGDRIDQDRFGRWIEYFIECDDDLIGSSLLQIAQEFIVAAASPRIADTKVTEEELQLCDDMERSYMFTPEDFDCTDDLTAQFLELLWMLDADVFREIGSLIVRDVDLENEVLERRNQRLAEKRFPSRSEAESIYEKVDLKHSESFSASSQELSPMRESQPLLYRVLEILRVSKNCQQDVCDQIKDSLMNIVNQVSVADGLAASGENRQSKSLKAVVYISLGLDFESRGNLNDAVDLAVFEKDLRRFFQIGFTLVSKLQESTSTLSRFSKYEDLNHLDPSDLLTLQLAQEDVPYLIDEDGLKRTAYSISTLSLIEKRVSEISDLIAQLVGHWPN